MARKRSRLALTLGGLVLVGAGLAYAFWPRPTIVDMAHVEKGEMVVTIDEEGRTRVRDAYMISTPIAGRLLRVDANPGDPVTRGETVVAQMLPTNPAALDIRTREQALAGVAAAEAALRVARADRNKALADRELMAANLERARKLRESNTVSAAVLDKAVRETRAADATVDSTEAAISMREAELQNARARLIGFEDKGLANALAPDGDQAIPIHSPATGRVLRVIQQSETTLPAGAPIMEVGNIDNDLEVIVELLSTDAVQVTVGDPVRIEDWGGPSILKGRVTRIDPWGFTKVSALGVEEQRVNAVIEFTGQAEARRTLGHGFRVEVRIVVWENKAATIVPSSALFRDGEGWAAFRVEGGVAHRRLVKPGRNNGIQAEVIEGLAPGDRVVLYPASTLSDGAKVVQRHYEGGAKAL